MNHLLAKDESTKSRCLQKSITEDKRRIEFSRSFRKGEGRTLLP